MTAISVESFVSQCQQSSQVAYQQFKNLLDTLDDASTRLASLQFLTRLQDYVDAQQPQDCHFQFLTQNILDENDQATVPNSVAVPKYIFA